MEVTPRFDGQTVVIIGATGAIAEALISLFGRSGASLAIQDIGEYSTAKTSNVSHNHGILVIRNEVQDSDAVVSAAVTRFGKVHVLIDVAGLTVPFDDVPFGEVDDSKWCFMMDLQQKYRFKSLKTAWSAFRNQGYGRTIHLISANALHGESVLGSTAAMSLRGLVQTLGKEGGKYNMITNIIATDDIKSALLLLTQLVHSSNKNKTGCLFEITKHGAAQVRWERSQGATFNPDLPSFTPEAILHQWPGVCDFSDPTYPDGANDMMGMLEKTKRLSAAKGYGQPPLLFNDRVVIVTGAGGNLGASYARLFAKLGANIVINDPNKANADLVTAEINSFGGNAISSYGSVVDGAVAIIDTAIRNFGRIDVLVNNAGFLLDQTFLKMTEDKWEAILSVHLQGTYAMTQAAWPYFVRQNYGRIINTSSTSGIYGFFGQANYSAAKLGIFGLTQALSRSSATHNIYAYAIAPVAGSQAAMNNGWNLSPSLKAVYNAPLVALLGSDRAPQSNSEFLFEQGAGWIAATKQKSFPVLPFDLGREPLLDEIRNNNLEEIYRQPKL